MRRARTIILVGLGAGLVLAVGIELRYGLLGAFVLIGWASSMLACLVFVITPMLRTAPLDQVVTTAASRENPVPA